MQHINLIEARLLPPQRALSSPLLLALLAAGLLAVGTHWGLEKHWMARAALDGAVAPAAAEAAVGADDPAAALEHRVAQNEGLRELLTHGNTMPQDSAALIREVIAALPDALWLTEIDLAGARSLRISGGALDPAALGTFAERLSRIDALRGVPIETLRLEPQLVVQDDTDRGSAAPPAPTHRFVLASANAPSAGEPR